MLPAIPFDTIAAAVAGIPFMAPEQGRVVYEHVRAHQAADVLELGTAHGVGAAYLAAAGAHVTTVDFAGAAFDPAPEQVLAQAGVADRVQVVRRYSTYNWWLKQELERSDEPRFDLIYLDGAKNWTIDGLAVVLAERLLRPGGWLLMDDLHWTYRDDPGREVTDGVTVRSLSDEERREPHLRAVFDLIVARHPAFSELRIQDDWWGWARKREHAGEATTLHIETTRSAGALVATGLRRAQRRARRALRPLRSRPHNSASD